MNVTAPNAGVDVEFPEEPTLQDALLLAMRLHQSNHFPEAEQIYRSILEAAPEHPDLLHFFGVLRHQQGHVDEGARLIEKALTIAPEYLDAHNNLGNIYLQSGQVEKAELQFRKVIALQPEFASAYNNLGVALKELERYPEAIEALTTAIDLEPCAVEYYRNLGNVLRKKGDHRDAVTVYRKALELKPYDPESYRNLSRSLYLMGEVDQAAEVLDEWLQLDPGNPTATHMLAAYTGEGIPERASDEYVQETFDRFAESFDYVLKRLDYKAPFLVDEALRALGMPAGSLKVLDAGCGTGLCGMLVRPLARSLVGIDLSPRMLDRARARNVYDELHEAELTAFLAQCDAVYDVVVCADTLCYFGDLAPVLHAARTALRPGGRFIFTLEHLAGDSRDGYRLNLHGRYSHTEQYVDATLRAAGLHSEHTETAILRMELGKPVQGLVITALVPEPLAG